MSQNNKSRLNSMTQVP